MDVVDGYGMDVVDQGACDSKEAPKWKFLPHVTIGRTYLSLFFSSPHGWMDRWMDEWVDEWMDGWVDDWMDEWVDEWMIYLSASDSRKP